ncbi:erythromycin esterase family protein [Neobacillus piezotolerans]|uniref:Erythromycin esterase family protein n=1 Tax=Neobacillus piezotolerans TaxID=2259171 RepID=A0A3D8GRQ6_9BACI|nr:erythromycin esterase family protein [Neobacillus piezotolerans]RDU37160.1 erythromycin esterase family protein [Neobacillus piezotolerans]
MKIFNKLFSSLLAIVVFFAGSFHPTISKAESVFDPNSISPKLKEILIPLKTTQAGNGFEDLQPLKKILKDVKILGMGEATHGTKEFFQMKHRMYEFLVEELGYRAFAIEAEFGIHKVINNYILTGTGSMEEVISAMRFWTWSTQEVADMIDWMKEYNQNPANIEKIRFYGFDMQGVNSTVPNIQAYLEKVDPTSELPSDFSYLYPRYEKSYTEPLLEKLVNAFETNKDTYVSRSSKEEYEIIRRELEIIYQNLHLDEISSPIENKDIDVSGETFRKSFSLRDASMADNVKWIHNYEKEYYKNDKIMLWAHNGHISNHFQMANISNMGSLLKDEFKKEYYSLGFDFYKGSLVTVGETSWGRDLGIIELAEPKEKIFSSWFKETGYPIGFLDFNTASTDRNLESWLSTEHSMHLIGAMLYKTQELTKVIPKEFYDGIINIEDTNAAETIYKSDLPIVQPIPLPAGEAAESEVKSLLGDNAYLIAIGLFITLISAALIFWRVKIKHNKSKSDHYSKVS